MASRTRKNVGVIGLGIIGQRVVSNLRENGFHVFVWNRTPRPVPNFVGSPAEVAELCDYVQIFVSDDDALLQMMQRMTPNLTSQSLRAIVSCSFTMKVEESSAIRPRQLTSKLPDIR